MAEFRLSQVKEPSSLKDKAYAAIKEAILSLQFEPGQPLVEEELARQLGVSKTPVRDALYDLERDGLVTKILFKGTYVTEITARDAVEIFQLRAVLEGLAARLATPLLSSAELDEAEGLLEAANQARERGDLLLCSQLGERFHKLILSKADNGRLFSILNNLDDQMRRLRSVSDRITGRLEKSSREHRRTLAALRAGDALGAEQSMRDHMHSVLQDLSAEGPIL